MTATATIKGVPGYKGYEFVIVEGRGVYLRSPDGDLVKLYQMQGHYCLGIMACTDLETLIRGFVDQREQYREQISCLRGQ